jgi:glycosyltransferase involved in cell wall biosynthesis
MVAEEMKLSIIAPVLNSHEILRRQFLHFERIGIPEDTEIIIVDDGSEPPLKYEGKLPVRIHATNDKRPWTWALARNHGARMAQGEYLLMFDIDHIITRELIDAVRTFGGQKMQFRREFAVLDENGNLTQDISALTHWGFPIERLKTRGLKLSPLPNNFAMRKDVFFALGGYREDLVERSYPQGEDRLFKKAWCNWEREGKGKVHHERQTMYMFPNGKTCGDVDFNPFSLFHNLSRKTNRNYWYRKQRENRG